MSNKLFFSSDTTFRAIIHNDSGQAWNVTNTALDAFDQTFSEYYITPTAHRTSSVHYYVTVPSSLTAGTYRMLILPGATPTHSVVPTQTISFKWTGSALVNQPSVVDAIKVPNELTHFCDGQTSRSVIALNAGFAGTLALKPDIGNAAIASVNSAALTGAASVTGTNLRTDWTGEYALYDVTALSTTGTYTATVSITTTDSQTIVYTGTITVS